MALPSDDLCYLRLLSAPSFRLGQSVPSGNRCVKIDRNEHTSTYNTYDSFTREMESIASLRTLDLGLPVQVLCMYLIESIVINNR